MSRLDFKITNTNTHATVTTSRSGGWIQCQSKKAVSARVGVEAGSGVGRSPQFFLESESEIDEI